MSPEESQCPFRQDQCGGPWEWREVNGFESDVYGGRWIRGSG